MPAWPKPPLSICMHLPVYVHTCASPYLRATLVNPLSHRLISRCPTRLWASARVCTHARTNARVRPADLEIRCHKPQIVYQAVCRSRVFCCLVECSEISAEDFHLSIPNKSIKHQREVVCKIQHFHAQIVIACPFCWHHICLKAGICVWRWRRPFSNWQNRILWSYLFLLIFCMFFLPSLRVEWMMKTSRL